jgi:hypothetical protein
MAGSYLLVIHAVPKPAFLALSATERERVLGNIAAPIQEFTAGGGTVIFSELTRDANGREFVVLIVTLTSGETAKAFYDALQSATVAKYFDVGGYSGPSISVDDIPDGADFMERVFKPFIDAQ